ncbi:ABC transporter ATP-binding protein [Kitasatospora sp. NPDC051984]|uniref:ABC transporter ATP-binding protein n=1 Tax=Kitasatospora sp. NPDC051984 TaxID=3364059 RepID=UPI0037C595E9
MFLSQEMTDDDEIGLIEEGDEYSQRLASMTFRQMTTRLPLLTARSVALAWRVDRPAVIGLLLCQAVSGIAEATGLLAMAGTIGALFSSGRIVEHLLAAWVSVLILVSAAGLHAILGIVTNWLSSRLIPAVQQEAEILFLEATLNVELSAYDSPGFRDRKDAAERGAEWAGDLFSTGQNLIAAAASMVAGAVVLAAFHPLLLPLLVIAGIPQGWAQIHAARAARMAFTSTMSLSRMRYMLRWHLSARETADQIRTGTMTPFLMRRYRQVAAGLYESQRRSSALGARASLIGAAFGGVASGAVWAVLIWLLSTGRLSAASGGAAAFALRSVASGTRGIANAGARMFRDGLYFQDWSDFLTEAGGYRINRGQTAVDRVHEVQVECLSYRYDGAERDALTDVSLNVQRGEVIALVGENGSGKTTLSKLLAGLYLPTGGAVRWDGVDTRDMDPHAAWKHTAVVPQDFARWPFTARQNITQGQPLPGGDKVIRQACEISGAGDVIDDLGSGLDTLLTRDWAGGEALSGGQWQRIALARAFYRPAPLLILDEPTSALDPRAEHRIFANLRELAQDRAVVLVTHRLANVSIADRIVVLEHGQIIQQGTFDELVNQPGRLRELWDLQNDRATVPPQRDNQHTERTMP